MTDIVKDIYPSALLNIVGATGRTHTERNLSLLAKSYGKNHIISGDISCYYGYIKFTNVFAVIDGRVIELDGEVAHDSSGTLYITAYFDDNGHILAGYDSISISTNTPDNTAHIILGEIEENKLNLRLGLFSGLQGDEYIVNLEDKVTTIQEDVSEIDESTEWGSF